MLSPFTSTCGEHKTRQVGLTLSLAEDSNVVAESKLSVVRMMYTMQKE